MQKTSTVVSTKGQVILPKDVRERKRWSAGTRLTVEETPDGVLLRPSSPFPPTKPEDVFGMLKHDGPPITLEEMNEAIATEIARRHARGRY